MPITKSYKKGFTLIELLITMGVALVVVTSAITVTIILRREFAGGSDRLEAVQNVRIVADRLTRDLRQATSLVTTLPDKSLGGAGASEIEFQNGHDEDTINYIKYYLDGADVVRQAHHYSFDSDPNTWVLWNTNDPQGNPANLVVDSQAVIGNYFDQLEFWLNGNEIINFEIAANRNNRTSHLRSQVFGRNIR